MLENRAWSGCELFGFAVTFCEEGVDWNTNSLIAFPDNWCHLLWGRCGLKYVQHCFSRPGNTVTFCEEGVDWNDLHVIMRDKTRCVTFCEEGVDWNVSTHHLLHMAHPVTFCEEGVDWNAPLPGSPSAAPRHLPWGRCGLKCGWSPEALWRTWSPSVRKVWIEMIWQRWHFPVRCVTFCEEGVDWNSTHT